MATDSAFLKALSALPDGYSRGRWNNKSWGVTVSRASGNRRIKLYGEALGSNDHVSFNLYIVDGSPRLKPCEMAAEKVIAFVLGFEPDGATSAF